MAKYTVEHTCGHEQVHQLTGPHTSREYRLESLATKLCTDCWQEEQTRLRAEQSAKDAEAAKLAGLPELTGSPKQIAWAESIRVKFLSELDAFNLPAGETLSAAAQQEVLDAVVLIKSEPREQKEARWWIDNRELSARRYFQEQFVARRQALCPTAIAEIDAQRKEVV